MKLWTSDTHRHASQRFYESELTSTEAFQRFFLSFNDIVVPQHFSYFLSVFLTTLHSLFVLSFHNRFSVFSLCLYLSLCLSLSFSLCLSLFINSLCLTLSSSHSVSLTLSPSNSLSLCLSLYLPTSHPPPQGGLGATSSLLLSWVTTLGRRVRSR